MAEKRIQLNEEQLDQVSGGSGGSQTTRERGFQVGDSFRMPGFEHRYREGVVLACVEMYDDNYGWMYHTRLFDIILNDWVESDVTEHDMVHI